MDPTTEYLSDYACRLTYEDLSPEATHQVKRTLGPGDVRNHRSDLWCWHDFGTRPQGHGECYFHCDHHRCAAGSDADRTAFDVEGLRNGGRSPNRRVCCSAGGGRDDGAEQSFRGTGRTVAAFGNRA